MSVKPSSSLSKMKATQYAVTGHPNLSSILQPNCLQPTTSPKQGKEQKRDVNMALAHTHTHRAKQFCVYIVRSPYGVLLFGFAGV